MNVIIEQMIDLVEIEYEAAVDAHGPLSSMHEGWAVALEEYQEAAEALDEVKNYMDKAWSAIRRDHTSNAELAMISAKECAIQAACEALQIAAVCKRFSDLMK